MFYEFLRKQTTLKAVHLVLLDIKLGVITFELHKP